MKSINFILSAILSLLTVQAQALYTCDPANSASSEMTEHVSANGSVFVRDRKYPELGEAYRDPSGLIWGDIVKDKNGDTRITQTDGKKYCESIGARLPTEQEFRNLQKYLAVKFNKITSYMPCVADRSNFDVLPGFSGSHWWSSTEGDGTSAFLFQGPYRAMGRDGGQVHSYSSTFNFASARCVRR